MYLVPACRHVARPLSFLTESAILQVGTPVVSTTARKSLQTVCRRHRLISQFKGFAPAVDLQVTHRTLSGPPLSGFVGEREEQSEENRDSNVADRKADSLCQSAPAERRCGRSYGCRVQGV